MASPAPSSDTSAELSASRHGAVGVSDVSNGYGYAMGGESCPPTSTKNIIEKYAFASTADGADVGDLTAARKAGVHLLLHQELLWQGELLLHQHQI